MEQLNQRQVQMAETITNMQAQNLELNQRLSAKEHEMEEIKRQAAAGNSGGDHGRTALVQKWAPDNFSGASTEWRDWAVKFRSYMGAQLQGELGKWMAHVDEHRDTSALVVALGEQSRASASALYSALIATCLGKSLVIVERCGQGEGLEAWRQMLTKYEVRSKQTRVMRLLEVLSFNFKGEELLDSLESFDRLVALYEKEANKTIDDDLKVGIVIKGINTGSLREHLLLHSERCSTYEAFRAEIDTIARAQTANLMTAAPMEIGAFGGGKGTGKPFQGTCDNCGMKGHKKKDCRKPGGGAYTGGGGGKPSGKGPKGNGKGTGNTPPKKACWKCGYTNHLAADCRASPERQAKYQEEQKKKKGEGKGNRGVRELTDEVDDTSGANLGAFDLCQVCDGAAVFTAHQQANPRDREDGNDRFITFGVDSAACRTVVPSNHKAARGYRVHRDNKYGDTYGTAKKGGPRIRDEGLRVLQTKSGNGDLPQRLRTRKADVHKPLLAVCDLVDTGHAVLFDGGASYAVNKATGRKTPFVRNGRGWDLTVELEAPNTANKVMAQLIAEMREAQRKEQEPERPAVELIINQGSAANGTLDVCTEEPDRCDRFFHRAVRPQRT